MKNRREFNKKLKQRIIDRLAERKELRKERRKELRKERFMLGDKPWKRFWKGPCKMFSSDSILKVETIVADANSVIDTKGLSSKQRKRCVVVTG